MWRCMGYLVGVDLRMASNGSVAITSRVVPSWKVTSCITSSSLSDSGVLRYFAFALMGLFIGLLGWGWVGDKLEVAFAVSLVGFELVLEVQAQTLEPLGSGCAGHIGIHTNAFVQVIHRDVPIGNRLILRLLVLDKGSDNALPDGNPGIELGDVLFADPAKINGHRAPDQGFGDVPLLTLDKGFVVFAFSYAPIK